MVDPLSKKISDFDPIPAITDEKLIIFAEPATGKIRKGTIEQLMSKVEEHVAPLISIGEKSVTPDTAGPFNTNITYVPTLLNVAYPNFGGLTPTKVISKFTHNGTSWELIERDVNLTNDPEFLAVKNTVKLRNNITVTRQGGLQWDPVGLILTNESAIQINTPYGRCSLDPFAINIPVNRKVYVTQDVTGATFVPITIPRTQDLYGVYVDPNPMHTSVIDETATGVICLGASYYAFDIPGANGQWYPNFPALAVEKQAPLATDRQWRNIIVTRQSGLTWDFYTKTLSVADALQITIPNGPRFYINGAFSIIVPPNNQLVLTADLTGDTFVPVDETTGVGSAQEVKPFILPVQTATNMRAAGCIALGACYWAFDLPGEQYRFYGEFPAMIPDNLYNQVAASSVPSTDKWNNVGENCAALGNFVTRLKARQVGSDNLLRLLFWGDSIFGRLYQAEMGATTNTEFAPPAMYRQNVPKSILDAFQIPGSNLKYFPVKDMTGFIAQDNPYAETPVSAPIDSAFVSMTGTWSNMVNYDYHYYRKTNLDTSAITFTIGAGFSRAAVIFQRSLDAATNIDVLVSVNNGSYQTPAAAGLIGPNNFSTQKVDSTFSHKWERQSEQVWSGLNTASTYSFRFTLNNGDNSNTFWVWGMKAWDTPSLMVIDAARGAHTIGALLDFFDDDVIRTKPDAIIFEFTMLNDSYTATPPPSFEKDLVTMEKLDIMCRKLSELNVPVLGCIPHPSVSEPAHYKNYIQFARSYAAKYGIKTIDFYEKWHSLGLDGRADGTHLDASGVSAYVEELTKVLKADGAFGSVAATTNRKQIGTAQAGAKVYFSTPYLSFPTVTITPVKNGATIPNGLYIESVELDGFTVQGTGYFNWASSIQ